MTIVTQTIKFKKLKLVDFLIKCNERMNTDTPPISYVTGAYYVIFYSCLEQNFDSKFCLYT
jgi:hypothetical protein